MTAIDERHPKARLRSWKSDCRFYIQNPLRTYRLRASFPFEFDDWDGNGHLRFPRVLVAMEAGILSRRPLAGNDKGLPDDEAFLRNLWRYILAIEAFHADSAAPFNFKIPASAHALMLQVAALENARKALT